jgi:hypothetical protein
LENGKDFHFFEMTLPCELWDEIWSYLSCLDKFVSLSSEETRVEIKYQSEGCFKSTHDHTYRPKILFVSEMNPWNLDQHSLTISMDGESYDKTSLLASFKFMCTCRAEQFQRNSMNTLKGEESSP